MDLPTRAALALVAHSILPPAHPVASRGLAALLLVWSLVSRLHPPARFATRNVAITGCDSGFGKLLALHVASVPGYKVLAGCLTRQGMEQLQNKANITCVLVDVTSQESMDKFREAIQVAFPDGLDVVVANAGIARDWLFDFTDVKDFQRVMDVNFLGVVRTVKSALPALKVTAMSSRKGEARVVIVASMLSRITLPSTAAYSASKHACAALADALRREMRPFNVNVTTIEPGFMRTQIVTEVYKIHRELFDKAPEQMKTVYGGQKFLESFGKDTELLVDLLQDPQVTVDAMFNAISTVAAPPPRITTGIDANYVFGMMSLMPLQVQDVIFRVLERARAKAPLYVMSAL